MGSLVRTRANKPKVINNIVLIPVAQIKPGKGQPRKTFLQEEIDGLAESIKVNGLLQPLTVRAVDSGYELVAGERRLRAVQRLGEKTVACIVIDTTESQAAVFSLLENIQRADLTYFEEAEALKNLIVEWGVSQTELGAKLGRSQSAIANKLRLLRHDEVVRALLMEHKFNERQARALLKIEDPAKMNEAIAYISKKRLSAAQTESYVDAVVSAARTSKRIIKPVVKDVRLFFNTINNAVKLMNQSGINASTERIDSGDYIEYVVRIPLPN